MCAASVEGYDCYDGVSYYISGVLHFIPCSESQSLSAVICFVRMAWGRQSFTLEIQAIDRVTSESYVIHRDLQAIDIHHGSYSYIPSFDFLLSICTGSP